jgi:hypothetical protein
LLPETPTNADSLIGNKVFKEVRHDTSLPLRDMIRNAPPMRPGRVEVAPVRPIPADRSQERPTQGGNGMIPGKVPTTDVANFAGVGQGDGYAVPDAPPDTNGAVGATQYVQWVNVAFSIFDKTTGAVLAGPTNGNVLWSGFSGRCASNNNGDPIAQYDKAAGRWVMLQPVFSSPYKMCVAVSQTSDALGSYNRYEFDMGTVNFPDYPKLGIWPTANNQGYFLTVNNFANGVTFKGAMLCGMDRAAMLTGAAATMQCFQLSTSFGGVLPGDFDGTVLPPSGEDESFMNFTCCSSVNFWRMHVDFANPNNTTLSGPTGVSVPSFTRGTSVPQKNTTQKLDSLSDRMMYRLAYRNFGDHEAFVTNHSVSLNSRNAVRWYEFRNPNSPTLFQSGNVKNKTLFYWMGSIAQDKMGNTAVGFSTSSANDFPGITYVGRTASDKLGKMKKHGGGLTTAGGGSQTGGLSRWGDYSAMSVDPTDDCTFYYTQEYLKTSGSFNWSTRVNAFRFNNCN